MAKIDILYHQLAKGILENGYEYRTENRPDILCKQLSSVNLEIPLSEFPLLTTKEMHTKSIVEELLWFLRGESSIAPLIKKGVNIWNKDAWNFEKKRFSNQVDLGLAEFIDGVKEGMNSGDVGRNYGVQWRNWQGHPQLFTINVNSIPQEVNVEKIIEMFKQYQNISLLSVDDSKVEPIMRSVDQISDLIANLRKPNPINRRHIVTAWNPAELDETALPPCHWAFEVIPRPLNLTTRIEYSNKDTEYLYTLWQEGIGKGDIEAKELLIKELEHVSEWGFTLKWHQRSVDTFLGLPFNIASYGLLAYILGSITNMIPLAIIGDLSNVHFYTKPDDSESKSHIDLVTEQLRNNPGLYAGPQLTFSENYLTELELFKKGEITFDAFIGTLNSEDFIFSGYQSFGPLKGDMYEPTV